MGLSAVPVTTHRFTQPDQEEGGSKREGEGKEKAAYVRRKCVGEMHIEKDGEKWICRLRYLKRDEWDF